MEKQRYGALESMMILREVCELIGLQKEVMAQVLARHEYFVSEGFYEIHADEIEMLYHRDTWEQGLKLLQKCFCADMETSKELKGIGILTVMMYCSCRTREMYQKKGIAEKIFVDTMKCFPRFIEEHRVSYGVYGFDRDFWTPRQIAMQLFRIGELEYELEKRDHKSLISLHIPSDAVMTKERCRESYELAREFVREYYPEWQAQSYGCASWLLAPGLREILPETSNIIRFQAGFDIVHVEEDNKDFLEWVYKRVDISYEELPEDTSLQRNMKQYLLKGGKIGEAEGILKEDAWLDDI